MIRNVLILHVDINSFYAQVELLDRPELAKLPVAVGGDQKQRHGVVLAKNEAAKRFAVQTGESLFEARRKCPHLTVLPPHHSLYHDFSSRAKAIYLSFTPKVESFGLDECWLDLSSMLNESESWEQTARRAAELLRSAIREQLGLTVSIGASWNKVFAKFGSDYRKPDAVTLISADNYQYIVWPAAVGRLLYVGPVSQKRLADTGILTIGQLAAADDRFLHSILGKSGPELASMARGEDLSPVLSEQEQKPRQTVGASRTFATDIESYDDALLPLRTLAEEVSRRLSENSLRGQTVHIFVRDNQFQDKTRQKSIGSAIASADDIFEHAAYLLQLNEDFRLPIRALGISVSSLIRSGEHWQPSLFDIMTESAHEQRRDPSLEETLKRLQEKYGANSVDFGDSWFDDESRS